MINNQLGYNNFNNGVDPLTRENCQYDPYYNPGGANPCGPPGCGPCGKGGYGNGYGHGDRWGRSDSQRFDRQGASPIQNPLNPNVVNPNLDRITIRPVLTRGRRAITTWKSNYLVSNRPNQAAHIDADLVNPWGMLVYNHQLWLTAGGTDKILNYDLFGNKLLGSVSVRNAENISSYPSGIAANCSANFTVSNGNRTTSSQFIISTKNGTVQAYSPQVDPLRTFFIMSQKLTGVTTVYKGLAIGESRLYLADFFGRKIDVRDDTFAPLQNFHFIDSDTTMPIPSDYGPYNIVLIGSFLYVLWAKKDPTVTIYNVDGVGNGYISVFRLDGSFVRRFYSRGVLNSPWAMIPAPAEAGNPPGSFLVANNGDGRIHVFDCQGRLVGPMLNQDGTPIVIPGVHGLAPNYTDFSEIFFTSSIDPNIDGLVGSLVKDQVIVW